MKLSCGRGKAPAIWIHQKPTYMTNDTISAQTRGMELYERLVDQAETLDIESFDELIAALKKEDLTGQFLASSARYLSAIDRKKFEPWLSTLIEGAIEKDRERRYIGSLLEAIWGADYLDRVEELKAEDNNFRRIYRRMHPEKEAM